MNVYNYLALLPVKSDWAGILEEALGICIGCAKRMSQYILFAEMCGFVVETRPIGQFLVLICCMHMFGMNCKLSMKPQNPFVAA